MPNRGRVSISTTGGDEGHRPRDGIEQEMSDMEKGRFQVAKVDGGLDDEEWIPPEPDGPTVQYTWNLKSLGQLTREALPKYDNYRDLMSVHAVPRPTLDELHNATFHEKPSKKEDDDGTVVKGKVIKFGWLEGVLMRCLLNIWGVMLFLRLSWVIGQAGILEGFLLITLANAVTFITAFSMSSVATNGQIKGGGIYYMISRSLGPEFGAAIGLMFTVANSIAVSLYIVGFCESLNSLLRVNGSDGIIDGGENDIRVVGIAVLVLILILAFVGMDWVTRTQMFLLVVLIAAQVDFVVGSFIGPISEDEKAQGFYGYSWDVLKSNWNSDYRRGIDGDSSQQNFFTVFGVFFPAVTGIVAGANLSGDLKDPASAIPKGTLIAIAVTYISYIGYGIMMGSSVLREATGNLLDFELKNYTDCIDTADGSSCAYGLLNDPQVMSLVSAWWPLIYGGCFAATLSSAIASLVGAPRVLQALAKDRLYPKIHFFEKGYGANNDPIRGYILVFLVSLGCLLIAKLNAIAPLLSNFFLAAYCLINFSVFHASITKSPGWRPSFKFYNAWVSLFGSILCVAVMFLMSWITALITVAISVFLYLYVSYRGPDVNWGSSTQAQSYNSALKSVQDLNNVEEHVKNFRPQILIFSGMPSTRPPLIDFGYLLVKNVSLMICAQVVKGHFNQRMRSTLHRQANNWLSRHKKKGFYTLIEDDDFERGCHSVMQTAGLGRLKPNMVLLGYKSNWMASGTDLEKRIDLKNYFGVIHEALDMHLAVAILRVPEGLDYSELIEEEDQGRSEQILDVSKDKGIPRNQSESQFSQADSRSLRSTSAVFLTAYSPFDGTSSESSSNPSSPKTGRKSAGAPTQDKDISSTEPSVVSKKNRKRMMSGGSLYFGPGGIALPRHVISSVTQFHRKQKKSTIDVWWLYDDGGLTILLPYVLSTRSQFHGCQLRIFTLTSRKEELGREQRNMAALLAKFRIDYSDVIVVPDITKRAREDTRKEFEALIEPFKIGEPEEEVCITEAELVALREKTNRHLRLRELLLEHSSDSTFVVMTLPVPRHGTVSAPLYMAWLEMMTKGMPPFLLVRGNQTSVLTFYS